MNYFTYIILCSNNKYYVGHMYNLVRRELEDKQNRHGAKFIKDTSTDI